MTTTYLGTMTLGELSPGLGGRITALLAALGTLRAALEPIKALLKVQADAAASLKLGISAAVLASIDFQLDAALSFEANLGIAIEDPATYLAGLLNASLSITGILTAPDLNLGVQLAADVSASAGIVIELKAQKLAIELLIDAAAQVQIALLGVLDLFGLALDASLSAEAQITAGGALQLALSSGGIALYRYDGAVSALGADLSTQLSGGLPGIGVPGQSVMALLFVAGSPGASSALSFAFKTSLPMADLGTDLDFDADLDPTFSLCSGRTAYAQAILHRFGAQRGSIATVSGDASYGYDLLMMLNSDFDGPAIPYWRSLIVQQCLLDERTIRADASIVEIPAEDKLKVTITLVDSEGPFQLVLSVDKIAQNIKILQGAPT